jgi:hypothetical protein
MRASPRYAFLIAASLAEEDTPRICERAAAAEEEEEEEEEGSG